MNKRAYLPRVVQVRVLYDRVVYLQFDDGLSGEIELEPALWGLPFQELARDDIAFGDIFIDGETIAWGNGADLASEFLYDSLATKLGRKPLYDDWPAGQLLTT